MTIENLNLGNQLQADIKKADGVLEAYNTIHTIAGLKAIRVRFDFGADDSITFDDPGSAVVDNLAATFISNLTAYRSQLQQQFDQLGTGGGAD